jgi:REP element-mobilizing transposase RayT
MPRTPRLDAPGATHHVMWRGVARGDIFRDDRDRWRLLELLERVLAEEDVACFAWAFMPNHVHLLLRTGRVPLSRPMARLGTAYASGFNGRHERVGHLFQDRFRSVLVGSDDHLRWLVRYIHRNPLEEGVVQSVGALAGHPWTGHAELMGRRPQTLVRIDAALSWFGPTPAAGRAELARWMRDDRGVPPCPPAAEARLGRDVRVQALEALLREICGGLGVDPDEVARGGRRREASRARALLVLRAHEDLGLPLAAIERELCLASGAAHRALMRARRFVREQNRPLRQT